MAFAEVLGHQRIRAALEAALAHDRLPSGLLFSGPPGVGKRTLALALARALVCPRRGCGRCPACERVNRGVHPDVLVLEPEPAALPVIKVDQVRDLVHGIAGRPFEAPARAFIVDGAHAMNEQASNALLKSLEEPPPTSHVVLVTPSPQALLATIRSRCQELRFGTLPPALIEQHLVESAGLSAGEARLRAGLAAGSLGAALAFDAAGYGALRDAMLGLLEQLPAMGPAGRLAESERLQDLEAPEILMSLTALRALLRDAAALHAGAAVPSLLNADVAERLAAVAEGPVGPRAVALAEAVGEARDALEGKVPGTPLRQGRTNELLTLDVLLDALGV